jgi:hypothetical protein
MAFPPVSDPGRDKKTEIEKQDERGGDPRDLQKKQQDFLHSGASRFFVYLL